MASRSSRPNLSACCAAGFSVSSRFSPGLCTKELRMSDNFPLLLSHRFFPIHSIRCRFGLVVYESYIFRLYHLPISLTPLASMVYVYLLNRKGSPEYKG
jgi:hypothetical protein